MPIFRFCAFFNFLQVLFYAWLLRDVVYEDTPGQYGHARFVTLSIWWRLHEICQITPPLLPNISPRFPNSFRHSVFSAHLVAQMRSRCIQSRLLFFNRSPFPCSIRGTASLLIFFLILCAFGVHLIYDHPHSYFPEVMLHIAQFHVSPSGLYMVSPFSRNVFTRSRPRWSNIILFIAILPSILYESIASHQRSCGSEIWYDFLNLRTSSNLYNRSCRRRVYAKYRQSCYIMGHMSSCLMCVIVPLLYKYVDARSTLIRSIILYGPAYSFVVAISC